MNNVESTYAPGDVTVLIADRPAPEVTLHEKEARIAAGESYGHFLTPETPPSALQERTFEDALARNGTRVAGDVRRLADTLHAELGGTLTLVSLARAGTPVGAVLHRELTRRGADVTHATLSVIRGVGLDLPALARATAHRPAGSVVFVDGWTGKGSITQELQRSLAGHAVAPRLAVLSDPAGVATFTATHDDYLLPHAALNATVSGLLSRTYLHGDAHAATRLTHLAPFDRTRAYVDALDALVQTTPPGSPPGAAPHAPVQTALDLARAFGARDPHKVKPSIGEATRVFLRRRPAALVLRALTPDTAHLHALADAHGVPVHVAAHLPYAALALVHER
ncbi:cysteine protease StiP family protein [Deinococcus maricopensis]|uniref:Uncharacterized protein n=1 Tax=Deinococcus maricopensis (strain DSM 21211 / LMG 22137 / NRRL B-23946 / LB-34) TaxID=709986 RepID=E8U3T5_DEIML|nr:cysteine protease StiP family protein [Deinococcus maricopensis]ADV68778.1 hypothetical protein Deima_3150 [Deinococcus maricopensis DSM 21211]